MAIPFTVEDDSDHEEALLQQLFTELWHILQQIESIPRFRQTPNLSSNRVRAAPTASTSRPSRADVGDPEDAEHTLSNSIVNLTLSLSPAGSQNDLDAVHQLQNLSTTARRRRRQRARSEPSCCEETKPVKVSVSVEVTNNDWAPKEKSSQSNPDKGWCGSESLFSKLVPVPLAGPYGQRLFVWSAGICCEHDNFVSAENHQFIQSCSDFCGKLSTREIQSYFIV